MSTAQRQQVAFPDRLARDSNRACGTASGVRTAENCQKTTPLLGLQRAMAASPLETGQAGKKVWLVKVPTFVAKQWRAAAAQSVAGGDAPELGRIRFSHDATQVLPHSAHLVAGVPHVA